MAHLIEAEPRLFYVKLGDSPMHPIAGALTPECAAHEAMRTHGITGLLASIEVWERVDDGTRMVPRAHYWAEVQMTQTHDWGTDANPQKETG